MWQPDRAPALATEFLGGLGRRWQHVQTVGGLADLLTVDAGLPPEIASAAWLHDLGYAPALAVTQFHPLDGARYLQRLGAPEEVVALVAHHTGAVFEAEERGLSRELAEMPRPEQAALDTLTLIDLVTAPDGSVTSPVDRVAEIIDRYGSGHPVHLAVLRSRRELLASAARARRRLGLADVWPLGVAEGMPQA